MEPMVSVILEILARLSLASGSLTRLVEDRAVSVLAMVLSCSEAAAALTGAAGAVGLGTAAAPG